MAKITVRSTVGERRAATLSVPALPAALTGLTVGFLDNTKHNFDRFAEGLGRAMKERFGVKEIVHMRKANASSAAAREIIQALGKQCDLVFAGSAD
jgi:hypothetical protein